MNKPVAKVSATPPSGAAQPSKIKSILMNVGVALVIGAALYGFGYSRGRAELASEKATFDSQIQSLKADMKQHQQELAVTENQMLLVQARVGLYMTTLDLERRNFGMANNRLKASAIALGKVKSDPAIEMAKLGELRDAIAQTDINVAVDLENQRTKILDFATQVEALTPQGAATPAAAETPAAKE